MVGKNTFCLLLRKAFQHPSQITADVAHRLKASKSLRTSSGDMPWTMFQYVEGTIGMLAMPKYLFKTSIAAVVPPRRAETMAAPGLPAKTG